jgi:DegV family protein with EDD domain
MAVKIIIDSTVDISSDTAKKVGIVPLTVRFGEKEYVDKVEIDNVKFYELLIESDVMPSTSQASISDFERVFEKEISEGNELVVITLSSKLSGTYYSATVAAQDYSERVFVVDSLSVSIGAGVLAERAQRLADGGLCAKDIANIIEYERDNIKVVAMFDTLEYLKRGGRISAGAAVAGALLSIKPVISVRNGEIVILGKARGSRQSNNFLVKEIENCGGIDFDMPLLLGYTGFDDGLLRKYIRDSAHLWEGQTDKLNITPVGSVVGTHAGPGAIAVAFYKH